MFRLAALACLAVVTGATPAAAQTTSPPGPWVIDLKGVTSPVPDETAFYPPFDATALIPTRGFGMEAGAHVYLFDLGPSRVGVGIGVLFVRATTTPAAVPGSGEQAGRAGQRLQIDWRSIAPQLSFNFGSRDGWSYLSAGAGWADVVTHTSDVLPGRRESGRLGTFNAGGGARWFLRSHLAVGFDLRLHRIAAGAGGALELPPHGEAGTPPSADPPAPQPTPAQTMVVVGVGLSLR